jgi:hypothetical protein
VIVLMCQPQFEPLIVSGVKIHTIRPPRKRPIKPGDELSLRVWTGKPYRSPQREILRTRVRFVFKVRILPRGVVRPDLLTKFDFPTVLDRTLTARRDGFKSWRFMKQWFLNTHGLPFDGELIHWDSEIKLDEVRK